MIARALFAVLAITGAIGAQRPVIVASKPFGESYVLAELFAQTLESRGLRVDRRPGLGATEIAFRALRTGAIDVYPEYTGTGLLAILREPPLGDAGAVFDRVSREFREKYDVVWLAPLGFQNSYAIAVRRGTADSLQLRTLSDLSRHASTLRAGLTADFIGRQDGLPGLQRAYGLRFRSVQPLGPAVKYQALAAGQTDVIDGYSTDGLIARYDLVVLTDDRHFFPPYEAAALVSGAFARNNPAAVDALNVLGGRLSESTMRSLNRRVEVDGVAPSIVAHDELIALGLVNQTSAPASAVPRSDRDSFVQYLWEQRATIARLTLRHVELVVLSLVLSVIIALPIGVALERASRRAEWVIRGFGVLQTIPGIALLAFMIPLLGIGLVPALTALVLYSLYPIVRNAYTGVRDADPAAVNAARALGMTELDILRQVRLPLATPVIMAGIRTAAVIDVGTATLAAFIGAGGLGEPIVAGLALSDTRMILSGAIPAAVLAIAVDGLLALIERWTRPGHWR